ncbi:MAG TPA: hypothetical protein VGP65_11215 [Candidatus Angelobacter sp.]|nr:hypothetical protein [Candidatus Angelobacter sp.]
MAISAIFQSGKYQIYHVQRKKDVGEPRTLVTSVTVLKRAFSAHSGKTALTPLSRSRYTANTLKNRAKSEDYTA